MTFSYIDLIFLIILVVCVVLASILGFVKSCMGILSFLASAIIAFSLTPTARRLFAKMFDIKYLTTAVTFIVLFILAFLLLKLLQLLLEKVFSGRVMKSLDHALGFFWGAVLGFAIIITILIVLNIQPFVNCKELLAKSAFSRFLSPIFADFAIMKASIKVSLCALTKIFG